MTLKESEDLIKRAEEARNGKFNRENREVYKFDDERCEKVASIARANYLEMRLAMALSYCSREDVIDMLQSDIINSNDKEAAK